MTTADGTTHAKLLEYIKKRGFTFVGPDVETAHIPRTPSSQKIMAIAAATFGIGNPLVAFASGIVPDFKDQDIRKSLISLYDVADFVGVSLEWGAVRMVLSLDADEITDEALIGKFVLLHERITQFRKYAMSSLQTRLGDIKQGTVAHVFLVFRQPYKADHFANNLSDKCKQVTFWKKIWTLPWAVDVPGKRIHRWSGFPPYDTIGQSELTEYLFT